MMDASAPNQKRYTQAVPMSKLLPGLFVPGIRLQNAIKSMSAKKKPRHTEVTFTAPTPSDLTVSFKPMPMAAINASAQRSRGAPTTSGKKTVWNSSVKVEQKKISHTANNKMKNNTVRKTLNFQPQPRLTSGPKIVINSETPKFPKPEFRAKKTLYQATTQASQAKSSVRISGICNIPQTPVEITKPIIRMTIANKENNSHHANTIMKPLPPASVNHNKKVESFAGTPMSSSLWKYSSGYNFLKPQLQPPEPIIIHHKNVDSRQTADTPMSNSSWKDGSDASFLQKEKEIQEFDDKIEALLDQPIKENLADISPPISTPFKDYRSIHEYFNNSSMMENSALYSQYNDNTIMCFDKPSIRSDNHNADESIVKLCNLFAKVTTVGNTKPEVNEDMEPENWLKLKSLCVNMINNVEADINRLNSTKELLMKHLRELELIGQKMAANEKDKTLVEEINKQVRGNEAASQRNEPNGVTSPIISRPCSVINETDKTLVEEINKLVKGNEPNGVTSPIISRPCSVIKSRLESPAYKIPKKNSCLRKKVFCKSMPNISIEMHTPVKNIDGEALNMYMKMKKEMNFLSTPMVNRGLQEPDTPAVVSLNLQKQLGKLFNKS